MSRADRNTFVKKTPEYYTDFTINLDRNPVTGLLSKLTNEASVKAAVYGLLLTDLGERPYQPEVGSKIRTLLFEPIDIVTTNLLKSSIENTLKNFEPRVTIIDINVQPIEDENAYNITIECSLINIPGSNFVFSFPLRRIR